MTRFRAPSTTSSSTSIESIPETRSVDATGRLSKVAKMTLRPDPPASRTATRSKSKRTRSSNDEQKKAMIKEARKLEKLRNSMKERRSHFVFIGNMPPTTTEAVLQEKFKACGRIHDICIRCTAGAAVLVGQTHLYRTPKDRQYASIIFTRASAVTKALELNGSEIHGVPIVVCLSAAQLPEVIEIAQQRIDAIKERKGISKKPKPTQYRGLMPRPTEQHIEVPQTVAQNDPQKSGASEPPKGQAQPFSRNFKIWGMTFAKTVV